MANTRLIIALFAAFLGGCVPTQTYIAPPREDNSVLKFSLTPMPKSFYFFLNGENCTDSVRLTHEDDPYANKSGSLIVPSNKLIALSLLWYGYGHNEYCNIIVSFKLEPNKDYELVGGLYGKSCHAAIVDSELSDDLSQTWINLKKMRSVIGLTANTCKPDPTHQALPKGSGGIEDYSKLNTYIAAITAKIRHNLLLPHGLSLSGDPTAVFEIEQIKAASGGHVISVKLIQSSGSHALDDAIERAIRKSDPLPPPDNPALFRRKLKVTFHPLKN
jgi:TonB family protein